MVQSGTARRTFLRNLLKGAATVPLAGAFLIQNPEVPASQASFYLPSKELVVPQSEPLVIATEMPVAPIADIALDGWVTSFDLNIGNDYGPPFLRSDYYAPMKSMEVQFGLLVDRATFSNQLQELMTHRGTRVTISFHAKPEESPWPLD